MVPETPGVPGRQCSDSEPVPTIHLTFTSWKKHISRNEGDSLQSSSPTAGHSEVLQRMDGQARENNLGLNVKPARAIAATVFCGLSAATTRHHSIPWLKA